MPERHKVVPAVMFALEKDGKILLQLRINTGLFDNLWSLPGGHVEPGEHVLQTVAREAHEELGIVVKEDAIHLLAMHHYLRNDGNDGLNFYYRITEWEGEPTNQEPAHCGGLEWFAPRALPENLHPEFHEIMSAKPTHFAIVGNYQPRLGQTSTPKH